jgi:cytochrome c oxidase subunit 1
MDEHAPASAPALAPPSGLVAWLTTVDHKKLGLLYLGSALLFLLIGGIQGGLMRLQLAVPDNTLVSPETFNQLFTMHGTTMVFLVGMPSLFGFGNYLVPLMIGARDMAFPRLNAFSFWLFFFSALLLYFSYIGASGLYGTAAAPDIGWTAYAPLTSRTFSPGTSTDYWLLGLLAGGFASLSTGANLATTIIAMRCPGMTLGKMPLFVWIFLVVSCLVMVTMTPLSAAQLMMLFDRHLGAHFFDTQTGGNAIFFIASVMLSPSTA